MPIIPFCNDDGLLIVSWLSAFKLLRPEARNTTHDGDGCVGSCRGGAQYLMPDSELWRPDSTSDAINDVISFSGNNKYKRKKGGAHDHVEPERIGALVIIIISHS